MCLIKAMSRIMLVGPLVEYWDPRLHTQAIACVFRPWIDGAPTGAEDNRQNAYYLLQSHLLCKIPNPN